MLLHVAVILSRTAENSLAANWTRQSSLVGRLSGSWDGGRDRTSNLNLGQGWVWELIEAGMVDGQSLLQEHQLKVLVLIEAVEDRNIWY